MIHSRHPNVIDSEGISAILLNCSGACGQSFNYTTSFLFHPPISHLEIILLNSTTSIRKWKKNKARKGDEAGQWLS